MNRRTGKDEHISNMIILAQTVYEENAKTSPN